MEIYKGKILYGFFNDKYIVIRVDGENLFLEREKIITITYNAGLEKREEIRKEIVNFKKSDIGIKIFFKIGDSKKTYQSLLEDTDYINYKEKIKEYNEKIECQKKLDIEKNAPEVLMSVKERDLKLIEYENKEYSMNEEEKFFKEEKNSYFARLDTFIEYYNKTYYGGRTYITKDIENVNSNGVDVNGNKYSTGINKKGVFREYNPQLRLIHWTAPLAQLYYNKENDELEINNYKYKTMLKRTFSFNPLNYINTYIMNNSFYENGTVDEFLLNVLREKRQEDELTDIIYTIQSNQNKIIRAKKDESFIVQGCAGSGKTMILLHRLSYLKFNNLLPEYNKIKIITPNKLFSNFIKQLSADLSIDEIQQLTISNYYYHLNNTYINTYNILDTSLIENQEYINFIRENREKYKDKFKTKFSSEKMIDENTLDKDWIKRLYSKETIRLIEKEYFNIIKILKDKLEIYDLLLTEEKYSIKQFLERTVLELFKRLEKLEKTRKSNNYKINSIMYDIEELNRVKSEKNSIIYKVFGTGEERKIERLNQSKSKIEEEQKDIQIKEIEIKKIIKEIIEEYYFSIAMFSKVLENIKFDDEKILPKGKFIRFELLVFLFVNYLHSGNLINSDQLICVDEAQDYNEIEYEIIKKVNGKNLKINLYGDVNQSFYSKGITTWENLCKNQMFEYYELNENYRNSIEITKFTNKKLNYNVLPMGISGKEVSAIKIEDVFNLIQEKQKNGRKIVIILSKDEEKMLFNEIEDVYFSTVEKVKGIEYDTVIVYGTNMSNTEKYISYTRALNELYILL